MPTPIWNTGYEHGVSPTAGGAVLVTGESGLYDAINGTPALVTGRQGAGSFAARVSPTLSVAGSVRHRPSSGVANVLVARWYFMFDTLPTATAQGVAFFFLTPSSGSVLTFNWDQTGGGIAAKLGTGVQTATAPLSAGVWYRLDVIFDATSTTAWVVHWQLAIGDGPAVAQPDPASPAQTVAGTPTWWTMGDTAATSLYVLSADDLLFSTTAADYPLGPGYGVACLPNADGTHNLSTDFNQSANGGTTLTALPSPSFQLVNARPPTNGGSVVAQVTASTTTTGYLEYKYDTSAVRVAPNAVRVVSAIRNASATQANVISMKASDDGFVSNKAIYTGFSIAQATNLLYKGDTGTMATKPSGGAWTLPAVRSVTTRWGYSTDVSPVPTAGQFVLEVDQPTSGRGGTVIVSQAVQRAATY